MRSKDKTEFYIVDVDVLPEVIIKVMEAKYLLETGKEKTIQDAVLAVGISRSAFYKYKDSVYPFYENTKGRTMTISLNMDDTPGILSKVLDIIAEFEANILTINQTIPLNHVANVTITIETHKMVDGATSELFTRLQYIKGVLSFKILARE